MFLFVFLPVVLALYYLCPRPLRNFLLLVASLIFYAWGEPVYILLMLFTTLFDYASGLLISRFDRQDKPRAKKWTLIVTVIVNLGLLGFFKYTDFLIGSINSITGLGLSLLGIALPIGISFYTFQTLSYTIDVYRGNVKVQRNLIDFAMYVVLFPQLIAGPIVRYSDVETQLAGRRESAEGFARGVCRFLVGLGKKVILANTIGALYDEIAAYPAEQLTVVMAWVGALAFTFQIYFDFSGYSDMAIGLGRMLGFSFPENFNYPYEATSITDFWRRWHMTLSGWFREYLYIPLGGNRCSPARHIFNLFAVWALTGLWHGAGWNFLLWGLYFFLILVLEKYFLLKRLQKLPVVLQHAYSLLLVVFSWVIFACEDLSSVIGWLAAMFGFGAGFVSGQSIYYLVTYALLFVILAVGSTHLPQKCGKLLCARMKLGETGTFVLQSVFCFIVFFVSVVFLAGDSYNPFLYFRF